MTPEETAIRGRAEAADATTERVTANFTRAQIEGLQAEIARLQAAKASLTEGLQWALDEGGWRLWWYADTPPPIIATTESGYPATIRDPDPVAARYLAVVDAARAWVACARRWDELMDDHAASPDTMGGGSARLTRAIDSLLEAVDALDNPTGEEATDA